MFFFSVNKMRHLIFFLFSVGFFKIKNSLLLFTMLICLQVKLVFEFLRISI